jgi:DNA-binding transcriptional MerR regulator
LSRTTILYYESCGLLKPALRSASEYRLYGSKEVERLEQIRLYRSVGLSVRDIRLLLSAPASDAARVLQRRLRELDEEISQLREHQRAILRLLRSRKIRRTDKMTKEKWVAIMKSAGFSEQDMKRWHQQFERSEPDEHQQFLEYLHIPDKEIDSIREWSRKQVPGS